MYSFARLTGRECAFGRKIWPGPLAAVVVQFAMQTAFASGWIWDQNGSGIDDRIETVEALGLEAAFENNDPVDGRLTIEHSGGWHRRQADRASSGGYHRRMGVNNNQGNGSPPTTRLVFTGNQITYFHGHSDHGGTADVFINGEFMSTVDYLGPAHRNDPEFGHSVTLVSIARTVALRP